MAISQKLSKRTYTGAKRRTGTNKRRYEVGRLSAFTRIGDRQCKRVRTMGGNSKDRLLKEKTINVFNPQQKKAEKATMQTVVDNKANKNFIRRNIITKGTIVNTDKGQVQITNRPGQEGTVNGVLVE